MEVLSNLLFAGTSGTADQVLTSNGSSLQAWENPSSPTPYAEIPTGLVNSSNTVYTLASTPGNPNGVIMVVDQGVYANGIDYTVSGNTVTFNWAPATGSSVFAYYNTLSGGGGGGGDVTLGGVQTLTNKTLTSPQINTPKLNTTSTIGYVWTANDTVGGGAWAVAPGGGGDVTLNGTQTLTNKTLTSPQINTPKLNNTSTVGYIWTANDTTGGGAWSAAPIGVTDGDKGDISVTGTGTSWTIDNGVVSLAKMSNLATSSLIGRATAGTGIPEAITIGSGLTLTGTTLSATGGAGGGLTWNNVTSTTQTAVVDNGYIASNASQVVITLPATAAVGKIVRIAGAGAGGWRVAQPAGQSIRFGSVVTTTGTGGYLESSNQYDAVELLCIVANTTWSVISSQGNIVYV